jgi:hypothetical protein
MATIEREEIGQRAALPDDNEARGLHGTCGRIAVEKSQRPALRAR